MSLRRLKLERIDLYQLHRFDPKTPVEESLGELKKMQQEGKIRHIGLSEVSVAQIQRAEKIVAVASVQNKYNITDRAADDVVEYCAKKKIAFIPWFPLAAGKLTQPGGVRESSQSPQRDRLASGHCLAALALAGDGADSRHLPCDPSGAERCCRAIKAKPGGMAIPGGSCGESRVIFWRV